MNLSWRIVPGSRISAYIYFNPVAARSLFLLNGIIKLEEGNYQEGIAEIEKSAWAGNHDLEKALTDVINHYMAKFQFFQLKSFLSFCFKQHL